MSSNGSLIPGFSKNPDFDFEIRTVLGHAYSGASDVGEVLAAVSSVKEKDHDGWFAAWRGLGDRLAEQAERAQDAGHLVSAAAAWLRAATYYGTAVNAVAALESDTELLPTFRKHREAWDRWVDVVNVDIERVSIPYEGTVLPGYLLKPAGTAPDGSRATLIAVNGSDGVLPSLWSACAAGALDRGYQVLLFDGPGQQSMLFEQGTTFRPDWEAVLTPVIDWLTTRTDVSPDAIAVYGISQAGYWVSRALAFEHRPAAAIVDPGVVDVSTSWTTHLPKRLTGLLTEGKDDEFDKEMALGMRFSKETARTWRFRARPYGVMDGYAETIRAVQRYTVADLADRITTPLLITDPEGEQFWPGQSGRLHELAPTVSTLARFTAAEGADLHCQPLGRALSQERIFDWLDEHLKQ